MSRYRGEFSSRADVESSFAVTLSENTHILLATYDCPDYDGYAFVLFERDGKLYEVNSSHCSCNGLEWEPEETTWEALKMREFYGYDDLKRDVEALASVFGD